MKKIFVSILNFNGEKDTIECLRSLSNLRRSSFELRIIVIDNASSRRIILDKDLTSKIDIKLIKNQTNLGFSGGHNIAIKYALENGADYILILNNDTYVDKDFLTNLLKVGESDDSVGILVPKIYFAPGFEFHKNRYAKKEIGKVLWYAGGEIDWANIIGHHRGVDEVDRGQFDKIQETELATGCCMLIKRKVFEKVGNFDDKYFLYYEDTNLTMRAEKNNFRIIYVPESVIWHKNAESSGGSGSTLQDYYITRNRLLFGFRFAPIGSKLALLRESMRLLFSGRKWQRRGVLDYYLRNFGKGSFKYD
jgi:GT2 family glycosyltransferase